jgi:hypothetical protein
MFDEEFEVKKECLPRVTSPQVKNHKKKRDPSTYSTPSPTPLDAEIDASPQMREQKKKRKATVRSTPPPTSLEAERVIVQSPVVKKGNDKKRVRRDSELPEDLTSAFQQFAEKYSQ